ncbi:MAG: amino acid adenylation domain-containing protein, partial [Hymenobacter sp.]
QLDERANRLSRAILHHAPAAELVGVSATRGLEMVISLLAILKAGKAYLPLDLAHPPQRLHQLVESSGVAICLATSAEEVGFAEFGITVIAAEKEYDYPAQAVTAPSEMVCVLYTSGSTGQPKGVCLGHAGLSKLLRWQLQNSVIGLGVNVLQFCYLGFDVSFLEIFGALAGGGTLYLLEEDCRADAGRLLDFLIDKQIAWAFLPYVALQYLTEAAAAEERYPSSLRELLTGGETLKITPQITHFFSALPHCRLSNGYGPTEASVYVACNKLASDVLSWPALPPIGRPIADSEVLILNEQGELAGEGTIGELCIVGECLALGYLHQPALTAEKFSVYAHPQRGPLRLYHTGDLARYLPTGELEFQGRLDQQVKIRGNRVELGEIEVALARCAGVQQAVVLAREGKVGSAKVLVAYIVAHPETEVAALRATLEQQLPDYMLPAHFVQLAELPKTPSGKVDRQALPSPARERPATVPYRQPATSFEKVVVELWASLLEYNQIGADDNFFELGGNSLLAQKTVALLKQH